VLCRKLKLLYGFKFHKEYHWFIAEPSCKLFLSINLTAALKQKINRKAKNNYCIYTFQIFHVTLRFETVTVGKNNHHAFAINIIMLGAC
jgi:hypothetical protein